MFDKKGVRFSPKLIGHNHGLLNAKHYLLVLLSILCSTCYQCDFWRTVGDSCDQDACVMTLLKSPWLMHPPLLLVSSSHRGRSGSSSSSVWRSPPVSTNASGMYQMAVPMERTGCCLSLRKNVTDIYEVSSSWIRRSTDNWTSLGGVFCGSFAVVGQPS